MTSDSVLTRHDLVRSGRDQGALDHLVRAGRAVRVAPSVYVEADAGLLPRVAAALEHAGPDSLVTGWAACQLLGLPYVMPQPVVHVLVPHERKRVSTQHVRLQRVRRLPAAVEGPAGVRLAPPARCVVDAARQLTTLRDVRALVLGAVPHAGLDALQAATPTRAGAGRLLRRALLDARCGAASAPEAEAADCAAELARAGSLPPFLLNADVLVHGRLLGRPDGWLPRAGLGWEVDSREHHGGEQDFERPLHRSDRFAAHGLQLLHVTPHRLRASGSDWPQVLAAAARGRAGLPLPVGLTVRPRGPLLPLSAGRRRGPGTFS